MKTRAVLQKLLEGARRAHENEEGSSMIFGAITMFTLALFTIMVWVIGMNSGDRLQAQSAADSAAYSGALVEAEALESIAFLNDGMAYVYYTECRYAIDAIVYSTLQAFHEHDKYTKERFPGRTYPNANSPGVMVEQSVGDFGGDQNNPGARSGQSYTPGISNSGPMSPPHHPRQSVDYSWVEMGQTSGGNIFEERYANAMGRAKNLLPRGKRWLADMYFAERVILYATPQLVKKTCIQIALENGAEWVAVSSDLDDTFELASRNPEAGFTDGSESGSNLENAGMVRRYTDDKANPIDKKARRMPGWFNALAGHLTEYSQVRLCWNKRDWDHCEIQGSYSDHQGYQFSQGAPAGHWHVGHKHWIEVLDPQTGGVSDSYPVFGEQATGGPYTHDKGHGIDGGPDSGDHGVPSTTHLTPGFNTAIENGWARFSQMDKNDPGAEHHAAQTCPTCAAGSSNGQYAEVGHTFNDGGRWALQKGGFDPNAMTTVHFSGGNEPMPRPILLKGRALRAGVTVATWRHSRGLTNQHFPSNDFGVFAIATGQIGIRNPLTNVVAVPQRLDDRQAVFTYTNGNSRTIALNANANDQGSDNFYLGSGEQGDPGMRFGARLVPVRRELSWAGVNSAAGRAAAGGLNDLLYGQRWWSSVPNGAIARNGTRPDPTNDDLGKALVKLRAFVNVSDSSRAFAQ